MPDPDWARLGLPQDVGRAIAVSPAVTVTAESAKTRREMDAIGAVYATNMRVVSKP